MLFFRFGNGSKRTRANRPAQRSRPVLEGLENRLLLTFHEFGPTGAAPVGIVLARDGNLWIADNGVSRVDRVQPDGTFLAPITVPGGPYGPITITAGPSATDPNSVWFPANGPSSIWRADTSTLALTSFTIPSQAWGITAAADGNIWFTEPSFDKIARLNPLTGTVTEFTSPARFPLGITAGAAGDNAVYVVCGGSQGVPGFIGRFSTDTLTSSAFPLPDNYEPGGILSYGFGITAGPDGNIWTGLNDNNHVQDKIEGFRPDGTPIGPFNTLTPFALLMGVASGGDGKLYFVELGVNGLGRFDPATLTWDGEASFPTANSSAYFVTAGPDDPTTLNRTVWSTELGNNKVAQYVIDGMPLRPVDEQPPWPYLRPDGHVALPTPIPRTQQSDSASPYSALQESKRLVGGALAEPLLPQQPASDLLVAVWSSYRVRGKSELDQIFMGCEGQGLPADAGREFLF